MYTFLDKRMSTIGTLTNTGGQTNNFWGDSITHSIATSQDVLTSVTLSVDSQTDIDTSGNQKEWTHTIQGLSFGIDGIGKEITEEDYLIYQDGSQGRYYLMTITQVEESLTQSGFHQKTVQGLNSAAYDLSRKNLKARDFAIVPQSGQTEGTVKNILSYIFDGLGWDVRAIGSFGSIDYSITDNTSAQAVLQDIIKMFEVDVDAYVLLDNLSNGSNIFTNGSAIKRVFEFTENLGNNNGDMIRLNRNLVSLTKTGARDALYTKLYVYGGSGEDGKTISIADANDGSDFIFDDNANKQYNTVGASSVPAQYLEGVISNSSITNPQALLEWGKKQLKVLSKPRYNYTVTAIQGKNVHLGDTVVIQDMKASEPIIIQSRIISKTISFADNFSDTFVLGEFSPVVLRTNEQDNSNLINLINQANQVALEAGKKADDALSGVGDVNNRVDETNQLLNQTYADIEQTIEDNKKAADDAFNEANENYENVSSALDQAKSELNGKLADANGLIQANKVDIQKNTDSISTKVSQDDFNTKTGELETKYSDLDVKASGIEADVADYKKDADGRISANTANITVNANAIKTKVSSTDYNLDKTASNTRFSSIEQDVGTVKADVADYKKDADGRISANTASININKSAITTKVSTTDYNSDQQAVNAKFSSLTQRADGFDLEIGSLDGRATAVEADLKGLTVQVGNKTDSAAVLELLADNFVVNLTNHSKDVVTSINADTSGVRIAGKSITLDGNVTTNAAFTTKTLSAGSATVGSQLTIGSAGKITSTYSHSESFQGFNTSVDYNFSGNYTINNAGITITGTATGGTGGLVVTGSGNFTPYSWNVSNSFANGVITVGGSNFIGKKNGTGANVIMPSTSVQISPFSIDIGDNTGTHIYNGAVSTFYTYTTNIGASGLLTSGLPTTILVQSPMATKAINAGPIVINAAHTIYTSDSTSLYLKGGGADGLANVNITHPQFVGLVQSNVEVATAYGFKRGAVSLIPAHFQSFPGFRIAGTNSGIVFDQPNKFAYVVLNNQYRRIGDNTIGTGSWDS